MATPLQALRSARTRRAIEIRNQVDLLKREPARMRMAFEVLKDTFIAFPTLGPTDSIDMCGPANANVLAKVDIHLRDLDGFLDPRLTGILDVLVGDEDDSWSRLQKIEDSWLFLGNFPTNHQDRWGNVIMHAPVYLTVHAYLKAPVEEVTA